MPHIQVGLANKRGKIGRTLIQSVFLLIAGWNAQIVDVVFSPMIAYRAMSQNIAGYALQGDLQAVAP